MIDNKTILVTGANGQLGMEFRDLEKKFPSSNFLFVSKEDLAINNTDSIRDFFTKHKIDFCINCAAYTAVDKAEAEQELALDINANSVGNLAAICASYNSWFIHFSTDYVFNGKSTTPYKEPDPTAPVNFYGETKLRGEQAALAANPSSIIIRTSWVYSRHGKNFVKTMQRLLAEKAELSVVDDQFGSPTYAADLAEAVMQMIQQPALVPGIFHYSNTGIINWFQFASAIKELTHSRCLVNPVPSEAYPTPAARPKYSAFDTSKISATYGIKLKPWKESLSRCIEGMTK